MDNKVEKLNDFLDENGNVSNEGTICDTDGNCVPKEIKGDKSVLERVNKKIIIEDGRQLLM
jgi:hypothetical protein